MMGLLGINQVMLREIVADGPSRVVALVEARGTEVTGRAWAMEVIEFITIVEERERRHEPVLRRRGEPSPDRRRAGGVATVARISPLDSDRATSDLGMPSGKGRWTVLVLPLPMGQGPHAGDRER